MIKLRCLLFLLLTFFALGLKPPDLSPKNTKATIDELLKAHACYHTLTPELVSRVLKNFLEELDPVKTYLLESEVAPWTTPSQEVLERIVQEVKKEDFSSFEEIHTAMLGAIERRNRLEKTLGTLTPPTDVKASEFKEIGWARSEEELATRLLRIRGLQNSAAQYLDEETRETLQLRLQKRRLQREAEIQADSPLHQKQSMLATTLKAVSLALDSQTHYFTPSEASSFAMQIQQKLLGIGAVLQDNLNGLVIKQLVEGSPAYASSLEEGGLRLGDRIIAVNNEPIVGMEIADAVELIRGPEGTPVELTLLRKKSEGEEEDLRHITLKRGEIILKDHRLETSVTPFGNGVIGICKLFSFYQDDKASSALDLKEAIEKMKREHSLQGIVLDLRGNAGGLLTEAVHVSSLFMTKGVVVSVKDNTGLIQRLRATESNQVWDGPLLILTNRLSASAAEIVAQTLQEYGRALVVGDEVSFGKGTFQTFTLELGNYSKVNPQGEYKVTQGRYYTVGGKSPQLVGVKADVVVPGLFSQMEIGEQFSDFPLGTDTIAPSFDDDLSDIPLMYRHQLMRLYKFDLQPVEQKYTPLLAMLKQNSEGRIKNNGSYQRLLSELSKKEEASWDEVEDLLDIDFQLYEAIAVMKDLILLGQDRKYALEP